MFKTILPDSFSEPPDSPTSVLCFIVFTCHILSRGSNTNLLWFEIIPHQAPSTFLTFPFTFLTGTSALLQISEYPEYHPSALSPGVGAPFLQAPFAWSQPPVSVHHAASVSSFKSSLKTFPNLIDWLIDDHLYSAILRSLEQTHCARLWFYMSDKLFIARFFVLF